DSRLRGNDEVEVTRNLKQAKPNEPDSHFRGNDGILGF
ncbi:pilus assembly protein PilS, partial [Neisseria gonorrhoeae]